jgi:hypothetical protein
LREVLMGDPIMQRAVLEHLAGAGTDPKVVLSLAPPQAAGGAAPVWQGRLLQSVIDRGDLREARALWAELAGVDPAKLQPGVYDGRFQRLPGPPPFNWQFMESSGGVAEPTRSSALQVEFYGRANAELASQLVPVRPGRYRLGFSAFGSTPRAAGEGGIAWRVLCYPSQAELASVPVRDLAFTPKQLGTSFTVPGSCSAVWLRLAGTSSEFPATHSVTISDLQLRPAS